MTARCNRISPELMEALQMLKFSLMKGQGLNFTAGTSKSEELDEMETRQSLETSIPDDMVAFIRCLTSGDGLQ